MINVCVLNKLLVHDYDIARREFSSVKVSSEDMVVKCLLPVFLMHKALVLSEMLLFFLL